MKTKDEKNTVGEKTLMSVKSDPGFSVSEDAVLGSTIKRKSKKFMED